MTLGQDEDTLIEKMVTQEVEVQGLDLLRGTSSEVIKVMMNRSPGCIVMNTGARLVMARRKDMMLGMIMTSGKHSVVMVGIMMRQNMTEVLTEIMLAVDQVSMTLGKVSGVTERVMSLQERIMTELLRENIRAKKTLVVAEVLLEVEMSLLSTRVNMGVAKSHLDVGNKAILMVGRNLLVAERTMVVAEVLAVADQSS